MPPKLDCDNLLRCRYICFIVNNSRSTGHLELVNGAFMYRYIPSVHSHTSSQHFITLQFHALAHVVSMKTQLVLAVQVRRQDFVRGRGGGPQTSASANEPVNLCSILRLKTCKGQLSTENLTSTVSLLTHREWISLAAMHPMVWYPEE